MSRILLIEDHNRLAQLMRNALATAGIAVRLGQHHRLPNEARHVS